ncbi:hypothetical protein FSP39_008614 [Pinctada imbricata]|uniref:CUB domain-containing protein n=1 Tax=Pinctada imbricata TaxID=66713 RepID=A0AA89C2W6_PINIB|nr:hypothetical protein FSP39_008614 [Pinctada imbricata]
MLRIRRSFYGYSQNGRCSYTPGDCTYTEHENYPCVGRQSCSINLPSGGVGRNIPSCNASESNYFQVDYECIPVSDTHDICNIHGTIRSQSGYLATPNYPNNYPSNKACSVDIRVEEHQTINLMILDMDLESNMSVQCLDWMYTMDGKRSVTLCGRRGNEPIRMLSNTLLLKFVANGIENHKGFWIYFEATPPLTTIPPSTTTTSTTTKATTRHTKTTKSTTSVGEIPITRKTQNIGIIDDDQLPFAAIVGGVIGSLSFILIVLLILLAVKYWKERRRQNSKNRFIEVQNPAYRNSNEFRNPNQQDLYYNYISC